MIKTLHIVMNAPDTTPPAIIHAANTIALEGTGATPVAMITQSLAGSWPSLLIGVGLLCTVLLIVKRITRNARNRRNLRNEGGESFAASVEIPPYVDTSQLAAVAADIDPEAAVERLLDAWMEARRKIEANPLYSPNKNECMARDAVEIERIFCGGELAKSLAKQSPEAFERFASTAQALGSATLADLIRAARTLAIKGHSPDMQDQPRTGEAWTAFRRQISDLEARLQAANTAQGSGGRVVTLADAYMGQVTA